MEMAQNNNRNYGSIIINFGLLVLCVSVIFYAQEGMPVHEVILNSLVIFVIVSILAAILVLAYFKTTRGAKASKKVEKYGSDNFLSDDTGFLTEEEQPLGLDEDIEIDLDEEFGSDDAENKE
jgi:hypothetical protein